jgi:hypothetical protein
MINPKLEILPPMAENPKQTQNSKFRTQDMRVSLFGFWILDLFRVSSLGFRVFVCLVYACGLSFAEDFTYNSRGKRDPFVPLVGAGAASQVKEVVDITSIEDVALEGIVYDSKQVSIAIINGIILKEGDQAGILMVEKIEPQKVILRIEDNRYEVPLVNEKIEEGVR